MSLQFLHALCLDPLFYTFFLAYIYSMLRSIGHSRLAELIYGGLQYLSGNKGYLEYRQGWNLLKKSKQEIATVSAQDEFAKWARMQRKIDKLQVDFDQKASSRQKAQLVVQYIGGMMVRILSFILVATFLYYHANLGVLNVNFLGNSNAAFILMKLLAFPSAPYGQVSAIVWAIICTRAARELIF